MSESEIAVFGDFATQSVKGVHFRCLATPNHALPEPPRFTFGPFPPDLMASYYRHWGLSSVGVFQLSGFELAGAFLLRSKGTYYRCPQLNIHEVHIRSESSRIAAGATTSVHRHVPGGCVILAGPGHPIYGHWLVEYLPKIALLHLAGFDISSASYLIPSTSPSFVSTWLELLGIRGDQIVRHDPLAEIVTADEFLCPTITHNGVRMSPIFKDAAEFMRNTIATRHDIQESTFGRRIFVARPPHADGRLLTNRAEIEDAAASAGFTIVRPEKLSLIDQVRLFSGCTAILGEYGSGLHGNIFSREGTVVCALRGTTGHPGFIQSGIGSVLKQPTGYIFGYSAGDKGEFGFTIDRGTFDFSIKLLFGSGLSI